MRPVFCLFISSMLLANNAAAVPNKIAFETLLEFCQAKSVKQAALIGDNLGWPRLKEDDIKDWKQSFTSYLGGTLEAAIWRAGNENNSSQLSFWITKGPNGHRACNFSAQQANNYLEQLVDEFGKTEIFETGSNIVSAHWNLGKKQVSYSQSGNIFLINIGKYD